jgi:hypothetical protein
MITDLAGGPHETPLLMPAVAITAPPIAAFEQDEDYRRLNALLLRNNRLSILSIAVRLPCRYGWRVRPSG